MHLRDRYGKRDVHDIKGRIRSTANTLHHTHPLTCYPPTRAHYQQHTSSIQPPI